jgi:hypothetical protein
VLAEHRGGAGTAVVLSTSAPIPAPPRAGVVLAAGSFSRNSEFRRRHQPMSGDWTGAADGDTGDAIQAGMAVGAATALMDDAWWVAAFQCPGGGVTSCLWERPMPYVDLGHSQLARIRRFRTGHRSRSRTIGGSRGVPRRRSQRTRNGSAGRDTRFSAEEQSCAQVRSSARC